MLDQNPFDRTPPQNLEAEQSILGSILLDNATIDVAGELLQPESFYRDVHGHIYAAMLALRQRQEPIDDITLQAELAACSRFELCGGWAYLYTLRETPSTSANAPYYAALVADCYTRRRLIEASMNTASLAYNPGDLSTAEVVDRSETLLREIAMARPADTMQPIRCIVDERLEEIERRYENKAGTGFLTPFDDLNYYTQGLHPDELTIIAARPSVGKTSLVLQLATHHARKHGPAVIFSLEMSAGQLVDRMICSESRTDGHKFRSGYLGADDWQNVGHGCSELAKDRIWIDDTPSMTIHDLRSRARRMHAVHGISLVAVDYAQLLSGTPGKKQNEVSELGEVARGLKTLSRELHIPVLALAQLNRAVDGRPDKRPQLSDLRGAGNFEQDADVVILLYRESSYKRAKEDDDPYAPGNDPNFDVCELIIGKQRNGPTGTLKLAWLSPFTRFEDLTTKPEYATARMSYGED